MKPRFPVLLLLSAFLFAPTPRVSAQSSPNVPQQYKKLFYQFSDQRPLYEKALNSIGLTTMPKGRSFALIAGVTQYPNFSIGDRELKPAAIDLEKLKSYLKDQEYFDEIVVLKDGDFNLETLNFFLQNYFPARLANSPHSRFLFAYSGHGYAVGDGDTAHGSLLTSAAISKTDPINRIDLGVLRTFLDPDIDAAEKVLVLVNACQSGAFLGRNAFGPNPLGPGDRGAHAIMASRTNQQSLQLSSVGPGSVFFEKIFAGLEGAADNAPRDGVVTYHELDTYLHSEIPYVTNGTQIPMEGDISRNGSIGEFFFLNRGRQVQLGNVKSWNPGSAKSFGVAASDLYNSAYAAYQARRYQEAFSNFQQAADAGNTSAMTMVGYLYDYGLGATLDHRQAREWYEKAADAGELFGMCNLGLAYDNGIGGPQDLELARQWYTRAANAGNPCAMNKLGFVYGNGRGVPVDLKEARNWYGKAANAGEPNAMSNLGLFYENGTGGAQSFELARQWYEKGANAGNAGAMHGLGRLYELGEGGATNFQLAYQFYKNAATTGYAQSMTGLGNLYYAGHGVPQSFQEARNWYQKGANAGDSQAMYNMGILYQNGQGVARDYQQARLW